MASLRSVHRINMQMVQQLECERQNWIKVLKPIVEVITFLSQKNPAFRGTHKNLALLEMEIMYAALN